MQLTILNAEATINSCSIKRQSEKFTQFGNISTTDNTTAPMFFNPPVYFYLQLCKKRFLKSIWIAIKKLYDFTMVFIIYPWGNRIYTIILAIFQRSSIACSDKFCKIWREILVLNLFILELFYCTLASKAAFTVVLWKKDVLKKLTEVPVPEFYFCEFGGIFHNRFSIEFVNQCICIALFVFLAEYNLDQQNSEI